MKKALAYVFAFALVLLSAGWVESIPTPLPPAMTANVPCATGQDVSPVIQVLYDSYTPIVFPPFNDATGDNYRLMSEGINMGTGIDTIVFRRQWNDHARQRACDDSENNLTIEGTGQTISGANAVQVLTVGATATVSLSNLTIANGSAASNGGGIFNDGNQT
jgi:hypothetical protein